MNIRYKARRRMWGSSGAFAMDVIIAVTPGLHSSGFGSCHARHPPPPPPTALLAASILLLLLSKKDNQQAGRRVARLMAS
jgi:hypothetical protein